MTAEFHRRHNPKAEPAAQVVSGFARFTVLTPSLIRIEWAADGKFEDRASFAFVNRAVPVPRFERRSIAGGAVEIETEHLLLHYTGTGPFSAENLSITIKHGPGGRPVDWRPGMPDTGNLRGTVRTLDDVNGACELEPGLLSRDGWALVDDSTRLLFGDDGWATPRPAGERADWYFLGHGHRYAEALLDFTRVAGRIPLPPRYVLGPWWSRYWAYTEGEFMEIVGEFERHDVPLDVLVVDMDWHLDGWTGYTWHPGYFPDPQRFLAWVHAEGLRVTLNLHPHDGVGTHEAAHAAFAAALGRSANDRIPFDCADPKYMEAYFNLLHHPMERQGVDFWWMDWQQGTKTRIDGLDPLFWLNHLHWIDWEENPARSDERPLIFSRWGGLGNHRYQIGFSGDTHSTWASLAFQPYFTATAGNVGYAWWSHDIGGHQPGEVLPEMYLRWIQWGAFSPILRTHGTKNPLAERRIWAFGAEFLAHARESFRRRVELVPYIYTAARATYDTGVPLCRPLYLEWPGLEEAYTNPGQYLFGPDLLSAPVACPASAASGLAATSVWLPPGRWVHYFTHREHEGPATIECLSGPGEFPLFARAGSIIPGVPGAMKADHALSRRLRLIIFPGARGSAVVYEDDGVSRGYEDGECCWLPVSHERQTDGSHRVVVGPVRGSWPGMMLSRTIEVVLLGVERPAEVIASMAPLPERRSDDLPGWWHDADRRSLRIVANVASVHSETVISTKPVAAAGARVLSPFGGDGSFVAVGEESAWAHALANAAAIAGPPIDLILRGFAAEPVAARCRAVAERIPEMLARRPQPELAGRLRRAWCALMGISPAIEADAIGGGRIRIAARLFADREWNFAEVDFKLDPISPLGAPELTGSSRELLGRASPFGFAQVFRATEPLPTVHVTGTAGLTLLGMRMTFPLGLGLFPSINGWWICGPFDNPWEQGIDVKFPPEDGFDAAATWPAGKDGIPARWHRVLRSLEPGADLQRENFVDLNVVFGKRIEHAVAYARCVLESDRECGAELAVGSDDGVAVFLNGVRLHANHVGRAYRSKADRVKLPLRAGTNELLLKITQGEAGWGFCAHVEGEPVRVLL